MLFNQLAVLPAQPGCAPNRTAALLERVTAELRDQSGWPEESDADGLVLTAEHAVALGVFVARVRAAPGL